MSWKRTVKDLFTFTKKDRLGALSLIGLILICLFLPKLFGKPENESLIHEDLTFKNAVDTLQQRTANNYEDPNRYNSPNYYHYEPSEINNFSKTAELFAFDPNTLPTEGWKKLGLNDRTIRTINNYRSKGGKFYKPEDLQKIWGIPDGFYEHVKDYIAITTTNKYIENNSYTTPIKEKVSKLTIIDINSADTTALIALPGIGSKLSFRITNFRDKLGGFYSVNQIAETYGLPDSTFQKIKSYLTADANSIKKFNINTATKEELKAHPYIRWNLANAIVEYRNQHGKFTSLNDLKKITIIDEPIYEKIIPYLTLQ